jgi:uncharacterized protein (DUF4415 family)
MPKENISIRLNKEVLAYFRGLGKGWQTKINKLLEQYIIEELKK